MPPVYNSQITRTDADTLITPEVSREILQEAPNQSVVMRLGKRLQNMSTKQRSIPLLNLLPVAYFVSGDTGLKQTTKVDWSKLMLTAEELAVIVPIPEAVLDDANYDIWGEIKPRIVEAIGLAVDQAVLLGTDKPASWPTALIPAAAGAGNNVSLAGATDLYDALLAENGVISKLEDDGFIANGHVAAVKMRGKLRGLRDTTGQSIFKSSVQAATSYELDGSPIYFPTNGLMDPASELLLSGDWTKLVYSIRQDVTYKILTEAVITDNSTPPQIIYNLAQQDMVAMRVVFRLAVQVVNIPNTQNPNNATRYPFRFCSRKNC